MTIALTRAENIGVGWRLEVRILPDNAPSYLTMTTVKRIERSGPFLKFHGTLRDGKRTETDAQMDSLLYAEPPRKQKTKHGTAVLRARRVG